MKLGLERQSVSALMIVFNEELHLRRSLESLAWCDEIIVVDGGSTDRSLEICRDASASWSSKIKVFERKWTNFRDQRNYSVDQSSHEWVFVLDADEECSLELRNRLTEILSNVAETKSAYKVRRQEYFLGKPIHFGIWNPSYQDRFFKKTGIRYINEVHEYPVFKTEPGRIHAPILHWPDFNPDKFLEKMNKYTTIEARDRVRSGQRTHVFRLITAGPAMFLKNYFYYKSYRDGMHGLVISLLEGVSRTVRHVKIWKMQSELASVHSNENPERTSK